jgi:hypothetical protein
MSTARLRASLGAVAALVALALAAPAQAENRLDRAAEGLQASPLYVHPELEFLLPEDARALIVRHLREANIPYDVKVAVMPSLEADESGGFQDRVLWAINDRLFKTSRLLIGVDQRGNFELLEMNLGRRLDVPFEIEYGTGDRETAQTIVTRLRAVFQIAATAPERGYDLQPERPTQPLDPLFEDRPDEALGDVGNDDAAPAWVVLLGSGVAGMFAGAIVWLFSVLARWGKRA